MNALSHSQELGNDWTTPPPEMLYQIVQNVPHRGSELRLKEYAQRVQAQLEQQMAEFEALHETAVSEVRRYYIFQNEQAIRAFFRSQRAAPQLLIEAASQLRKNFGENTIFNLRLSVDEYGARSLYAVVAWLGHVREVRKALEHFDEQWWIANSGRASGDVTFTYELG
jgi:hypothetical protein